MPNKKIKLKTGFEIAHGEFEGIKTQLITSGVVGNCCDMSALFDASVDPDKKIEGATATHLKNLGLLNEDGDVPEAVQNVILSAAGYESQNAALEDGRASCPILHFDEAIRTIEPSDVAEVPFRHRRMEELIYTLTFNSEDFVVLLKEADLSDIGEGNADMRARVGTREFLNLDNPKTQLAIFLRAYPNEAKDLVLWAFEGRGIEPNDPAMEFYAANGLLYERATRPADFVYEGLSLEIPDPLNRVLNRRQEKLAELQRQAFEPG